MSIHSTPNAYEFDLTGHTHFTGTMQFNAAQIATITAVHYALLQPIVRCNFQHEVRVANNYTQEEVRRITSARKYGSVTSNSEYTQMTQNCLCPAKVRTASPLCAHASDQHEPAPYGNQLKALIHLQIIHREQWTHWFKTFMHAMIKSSDQAVAENRYNTTVNTPEWRAQLQDRDAQFLEEKRLILVNCTSKALAQ
jgi:hypothetical protein